MTDQIRTPAPGDEPVRPPEPADPDAAPEDDPRVEDITPEED